MFMFYFNTLFCLGVCTQLVWCMIPWCIMKSSMSLLFFSSNALSDLMILMHTLNWVLAIKTKALKTKSTSSLVTIRYVHVAQEKSSIMVKIYVCPPYVLVWYGPYMSTWISSKIHAVEMWLIRKGSLCRLALGHTVQIKSLFLLSKEPMAEISHIFLLDMSQSLLLQTSKITPLTALLQLFTFSFSMSFVVVSAHPAVISWIHLLNSKLVSILSSRYTNPCGP